MNLVLKDRPEKGQSFWRSARSTEAVSTRSTKSDHSSFATWCRAALNLVFGSCTFKYTTVVVFMTSAGKIRSLRRAWVTSLMRHAPPQEKAKAVAVNGHPQSSAVARTGRRCDAWTVLHVATSQVSVNSLRTAGWAAATSLTVSA